MNAFLKSKTLRRTGWVAQAGLLGFATGILVIQAVAILKLGSATTASLLISALCGWLVTRHLAGDRAISLTTAKISAVVATSAVLMAPWWVSVASQFSHGLTLEQLESSGITQLLNLSMVLPLMLMLTAGLTLTLRRANFQVRSTSSGILLGAVVSFCLAPVAILPFLGFTLTALLALVAILSCLIFAHHSESQDDAALESESFLSPFPAFSMAVVTGGGLAVATAVATQLMPQTLATEFGVLAGICLGFCLQGLFRTPRMPSSETRIAFLIAPACWMVCLLALYPIWLNSSLSATAYLSSPLWLAVARNGIAIILTAPAGWLIARMCGPQQIRSHARRSGIVLCALLGMLLARSLPLTVFQVALGTLCLSILLAMWFTASQVSFAELHQRRPWRAASFVAVALIGMFFSGNFQPHLGEKVLFSAGNFQALRQGMKSSELPYLDDGRLIAEVESLTSRWSAWTYRGAQLLVRRNGLSNEYRSTNPRLTPNSAADVVPTVMALCLHPAADHVLVLGMHTPTLETCFQFPLQTVTVLEEDPAAFQLSQSLQEQGKVPPLSQDPRFHFHAVPLEAGVSCRHSHPYDVIVATNSQAVTIAGSRQFLNNFYASARNLLSEDGVFCQRLSYYDLGPAVVASLVSTFDAAFPGTLITESVPGELLLLGTRTGQPVIDDALAKRLQLPQARRVLAEVGLDWSAILGRGGLDQSGVDGMLASRPQTFSLNTSRVAFSLPREMMTWGDKANNTRRVLGQHGKALTSFLGESKQATEINHRLEDLQLAQRIQGDHPDEPWVYRAIIKQQLKDRPRSAVIQVKGEGLQHGLHPDDQRRKNYFMDLGMVATQEHPPVKDVKELLHYTAPYDPLVSLFVHHEVARLLERTERGVEADRFEQLLHTIYHSSAGDLSVRNVAQAIELLCHEPRTVVSSQQRWDHLNGLLEVMSVRWQLRLATNRQRKYEQEDADRSARAVELAMRTMATLRPELTVNAEEWSLRSDVLEQKLVRPIRQHRSRLMKQVAARPPVPLMR